MFSSVIMNGCGTGGGSPPEVVAGLAGSRRMGGFPFSRFFFSGNALLHMGQNVPADVPGM